MLHKTIRVIPGNEAGELAVIDQKTERRQMERRELEQRLCAAEKQLVRERKRHRKEMDQLVCFGGCTALLVVTAVCILSDTMWTAVLPIVGMLLLMCKAGWLK